MAEYTEAQLKAAAKKALAAGDTAAAKRLIAQARAVAGNTAENAALSKSFQSAIKPTGQHIPDQNAEGVVSSALRGALQGATFGGSDEILAGMLSLHPDISYDDALGYERGKLESNRAENPWSAYGGEVLGAVAAPGAVLKGGGNLAARAAKSGATALASGGLYGFLAGEDGLKERGKSALATGLISGLVGAAAPVAGKVASKVYEGFAGKSAIKAASKAAPSADDLRNAATALYKQAEGVQGLPRADFADDVTAIIENAARKGMDDDLTPGAAKVASRLGDAADSVDQNIGFRELDILRRKAAVPAGNLANRTESAIGSEMIEGIDDFVDNADPALAGIVAEARKMWGKLRRNDLIDDAMKRADLAASGYENGLAIEFRRLLKDPKKMRGFSASEKLAMEAVVKGTPFGNLVRQIGKMGIGLNRQSNGLGAMVSSGLGGASLGLPGAIAFPLIGTAAKAGANYAKRAAADRAAGLVRAGGIENMPQLPEATRGLIEGILRRGAIPLANQVRP